MKTGVKGEAGPLLSMGGSSLGIKSQAKELLKVGWQKWPDPDPLLGAVVCSCNPTAGKQDQEGWHGTSGPVGPSFGSDFSDLLWRGPALPFWSARFLSWFDFNCVALSAHPVATHWKVASP